MHIAWSCGSTPRAAPGARASSERRAVEPNRHNSPKLFKDSQLARRYSLQAIWGLQNLQSSQICQKSSSVMREYPLPGILSVTSFWLRRKFGYRINIALSYSKLVLRKVQDIIYNIFNCISVIST